MVDIKRFLAVEIAINLREWRLCRQCIYLVNLLIQLLGITVYYVICSVSKIAYLGIIHLGCAQHFSEKLVFRNVSRTYHNMIPCANLFPLSFF